MKNDAGKYDSYSDGGLPNGPRQEPAPPRATTESERRDQLYKVWLNYNQLPGSVESRKLFDSACAILAPRGAQVASAGNALSERDAFEAWWSTSGLTKFRETALAGWEARAALAQSTPHVPADPLQGAADWLKQAFEDCTVGDLQRNLRIGYNRASRLFSAAPHVPAGEQVAEFEQAVAACAKLHTEYMGKVMTDEVYDRFATLRDETIPRLRKALATPRAPEPAAPVAQEPVAEVSAETFNDDGTSDIITSSLPIGTKLYAAPTAAQGLSGVEIALRDLLDSYMSQMPPDEAAAILSANRAAQETK